MPRERELAVGGVIAFEGEERPENTGDEEGAERRAEDRVPGARGAATLATCASGPGWLRSPLSWQTGYRPSRRIIPDLATWCQCYALFVAVLAEDQPGLLPDLMAYIIDYPG